MQSQKTIVILIALGCLVMFALVIVIILFVVVYQRKMLLKEAKIKLMEQEKQLALFKASVEAEEQQKEKIARNLHDEINPLLAVLKFNLSKHRIQARKNQFEPDSLIADAALLDKAIEGIRTTCHDLIPSFLLQHGLLKSLEDYLAHVQQMGDVQVAFENEIDEEALASFPKQDQLNTYRICLEILNNIFKHAQCSTVKMKLSLNNHVITILIKHNGQGVSNEEMDTYTDNSEGLGLKSLKARALILNATITYIKENQQSSVTLSIPYHHE
jgi:signal transduction histidine kinase